MTAGPNVTADSSELELVVTRTFDDEEYEGKTKLTRHETGFESVGSHDSHHEGFLGTLGRLDAYLAAL